MRGHGVLQLDAHPRRRQLGRVPLGKFHPHWLQLPPLLYGRSRMYSSTLPAAGSRMKAVNASVGLTWSLCVCPNRTLSADFTMLKILRKFSVRRLNCSIRIFPAEACEDNSR